MARAKKERAKYVAVIESLDQEGRGVARRDGKVVFIEGALPGEKVEYEVYRSKPSFELGLTTEIYKESPLRVLPKCPHFGVKDGSCGGCAMQHLEAHAQVAMKQKVLMDALWHIGRVRPEQVLAPIYGSAWRYRHRARLSVREVAKKGTVLVGFHEKRSSFIADMKSCEILPKRVSDLLVPLRELINSLSLRKKLPQIELAVTDEALALVLRVLEKLTADDEAKLRQFQKDYGVDFWYQPKGLDSIYPMEPENATRLKQHHRETGVEVVFRPTDFTQVNHRLNEVMVTRALRLLHLEPSSKVIDFFCGLGNFTLPLATRSAKVLGIEGSTELVDRARAGAKDNNLADKTEFEARNLFDWTLDDWDAVWNKLGGVDRVLIDPPREGAMALCRSLADTDKRPARLVYVSCNPATLARDAALLVREGGWKLLSAGVMNMFPHTAHVESIAVFEPGPKPEKIDEIDEIEIGGMTEEAEQEARSEEPKI